MIARYKATIEEELGIPSRRTRHQQLWGAIGAVFCQLDECARHHLPQAP
jgi:hypothetical protein